MLISHASHGNKQKIVLSNEQVKEYLPHRYPFLLVDEVPEVIVGKSIRAIKHIAQQEPVFQGHFPENPIYPGVYIIEGIAQAGAILTFLSRLDLGLEDVRFAMLTGVNDVRFRKAVLPGDLLEYHVELLKQRNLFAWLKGVAKVGHEIVAEMKISAIVGDHHKA
jgi:3-hydroxyacyl-[acyl-carrier-protein] dehydratase